MTAWADAVAEALEHAPERVATTRSTDARPGAPWRRRARAARALRAAGPALTAVADAVAAVHGGATAPRDAAILAALQTAPADGEPPVSLARAVLRSALEARQDARAVVSRHG